MSVQPSTRIPSGASGEPVIKRMNLMDHPREVHEKILSYLSPKDLFRCTQVSKTYRSLANREIIHRANAGEKLVVLFPGMTGKRIVDKILSIEKLEKKSFESLNFLDVDIQDIFNDDKRRKKLNEWRSEKKKISDVSEKYIQVQVIETYRRRLSDEEKEITQIITQIRDQREKRLDGEKRLDKIAITRFIAIGIAFAAAACLLGGLIGFSVLSSPTWFLIAFTSGAASVGSFACSGVLAYLAQQPIDR